MTLSKKEKEKPSFVGSRLFYVLCSLLLFLIEYLIAAYVHDKFVRPYVGDVLVVVLVYCMVRIVVNHPWRWLPLAVLLFACSIEAMQYFQMADILGLENNTVARIVLGSVFDWKDILCYTIGCLPLWLIRK